MHHHSTNRSAEDAVYTALRDAIVRLEVELGQTLGLSAVAPQFGVSPTPIRQALRLLHGDGLGVSIPCRDTRGAPLTAAEVEEIQCVRLGLETRLARLGALRCSTEALGEMERVLLQIAHAQADGEKGEHDER